MGIFDFFKKKPRLENEISSSCHRSGSISQEMAFNDLMNDLDLMDDIDDETENAIRWNNKDMNIWKSEFMDIDDNDPKVAEAKEMLKELRYKAEYQPVMTGSAWDDINDPEAAIQHEKYSPNANDSSSSTEESRMNTISDILEGGRVLHYETSEHSSLDAQGTPYSEITLTVVIRR